MAGENCFNMRHILLAWELCGHVTTGIILGPPHIPWMNIKEAFFDLAAHLTKLVITCCIWGKEQTDEELICFTSCDLKYNPQLVLYWFLISGAFLSLKPKACVKYLQARFFTKLKVFHRLQSSSKFWSTRGITDLLADSIWRLVVIIAQLPVLQENPSGAGKGFSLGFLQGIDFCCKQKVVCSPFPQWYQQ